MAEQIPGATFLGMSFNTYETYDSDSGMDLLFTTNWTSDTWTDPESGITYLLPENAAFDSSVTSSEGELHYYQDRSTFEESFSSKAKISASYGNFSGQFSASYNSTTKKDDEYQYSMVQTTSRFWRLTMEDQSENALADYVKDDPDFQDLPDTYNSDTREAFFRFLDKYGAYYVVSVTVGGRLYYSASVEKSYQYSSEEIDAKFKAEYKAVFTSVGAEASAEWKKAGEEWAENRLVTVAALGGNSDLLNVLAPDYGDSFSADFATWNESTRSLPGIVDLTLKSMANLFSGDKAEAMREAIKDWEGSKVVAESKTETCSISVSQKLVLPAAGGNDTLGFQLAAIDRENLTTAFAESYSQEYAFAETPAYARALEDIEPFRSEDYWIVFTTWGQLGYTFPPPDFYDFLVDCGAGEGLDQWISASQANQPEDGLSSFDVYYCEVFNCTYVLAGIPGAGKNWAAENDLEAFGRAGSCDTGEVERYPQQARRNNQPAPSLSIVANLYYQLDDAYALADGRRMGPSYREHSSSR